MLTRLHVRLRVCACVFAEGVYPWTMSRYPAVRDYQSRFLEPGEWLSSSCFLWPINFLFLNNQIPFGGCMGWTWSLAIQGQFYFAFPIILKLTVRHDACGTHARPSRQCSR
jgi:peptidoglycan/LPS O-acetylase OafA/YrhL